MAGPGIAGAATGTIETAVGFALGIAVGRALGPIATTIEQEAYSVDPSRAVDPLTAAAIVAEAVEQMDWGKHEAVQSGLNSERFAAIVGEVLNAPGVAELLTLWRREDIGDAELEHGFRKSKLEPRWDDALKSLRELRLDPAVVATAIQRGIIADPGILPVGPPSAAGRVPPMPVADVDALKEAASAGYGFQRLAAITRIVGLPPAPGELLQLINRGEIDETDYLRGIAEGNTRNEWGPFLLKLRRRLLTPHEYAELRLRGWIADPEMYAGARLSGFEDADTELLHKMLGRPLAAHQITTGLARGGEYTGGPTQAPEPYLRGFEESNLRPEWYSLAYANRYTLPSAFVMRQLLRDGALPEAEGAQLMKDQGWPPALAEKVAAAYAAPVAGKGDPHVAKAETQLWSTIHRSYVGEESDEAEASAALEALGVTAPARARVLELWNHERAIVRRQLSPSQVKKAYKDAIFTRDQALARLLRLGYNAADATTLLEE